MRKLDFESDVKLQKYPVESQDQMNRIMQFEKTRIMDLIYINHQVKFHEIMAANKEFDLENDEDYKALQISQNAERQKILDLQRKENKLSADDMVFVKKICTEIGSVNVDPGMIGVMAFEEFTKIFTAVVKVQVILCRRIEDAAAVERRNILKEPETEETQQKYGTCCMKMMHDQQTTKNRILHAILETFGV